MTRDDAFWRVAGRILNAGQTRSLVLSGNIHDLFRCRTDDGCDYVPLIDFLIRKWRVRDKILLVYEINGPLRLADPADEDLLRHAWVAWRTGATAEDLALKRLLSPRAPRVQAQAEAAAAFDAYLLDAVGKPTLALELIRQLCLASRTVVNGRRCLEQDLIILIEGAELIIPDAPITSLGDGDRHRVNICRDWFSDPGFMNGGDVVVLLSESRSLLNHQISRLPQVLEVAVPAPGEAERLALIRHFADEQPLQRPLKLWSTPEALGRMSAGLSLHALLQLLRAACYTGQTLQYAQVLDKVQEFIQTQLGEDVVEFKKPDHRLDGVVGFARLKGFLRDELIPRFSTSGPEALPGAAVAGPIGGGKTFIFEAVAAELDSVVLTLKNIRSQWYGQTDVIFERLRRVLDALHRVVIFVDEADTQFGGVGADAHATERRLTGKIQAMMSDPRLRGRVFWLLMTARIHLLSPDIRRPGRVGDLIIPVLDPRNDDRTAFLRWMVEDVLDPVPEDLSPLDEVTAGYAAANFAALRAELRAKAAGGPLSLERVLGIAHDHLPPAIGETRRYQTLQALLNCTRRSLLPEPDITEQQRQAWADEIRAMEARGVR